MARRAGLGRRVSGAAGLIAGAAALVPSFSAEYLALGFQTSIVACAALVVSTSELVRDPRSARTLLVSSASVVVVAHSWQLLLPGAGIIWLWSAAHWVREARSQGRTRSAVVRCVLAAMAVSVAVLPSLIAATRPVVGGIQAAATPGDISYPPIGWMLGVGIAWAVIVIRGRTLRVGGAPAVVGGALAISSLALAGYLGIPIASYYPTKILWTATVVGLPLIGLAFGHIVSLLNDRSGLAPRLGLVLAGGSGGIVVLVGLATPISSLTGSWSTVDPDIVMRTVTSARAPEASVVWGVSTPVDDAASQLTLEFYRAGPSDPVVLLPAATIDEQCGLLGPAATKVVISSRPASEVITRFTCVAGILVDRPVGE